MSKEYNIYLGQNPLSFDLLVKDRVHRYDMIVTEQDRVHRYDMIVTELSYRNHFSIKDGIVLDSCLRGPLMLQDIAVSSGMEISSHISDVLEYVRERFSDGMVLSTEVSAALQYAVRPKPHGLVLDSGKLEAAERVAERVASGMEIAASKVDTIVASFMSPETAGLVLSAGGLSVHETVREEAEDGLVLSASLPVIHASKMSGLESGIVLDSKVGSFIKQIYKTVSSQLVLDCYLADAMIQSPIWPEGAGMVISDELSDDAVHAFKYEQVMEGIELSCELASELYGHLEPERNGVVLSIYADILCGRARLLSDMDPDSLSAYDDMALSEVDFFYLD